MNFTPAKKRTKSELQGRQWLRLLWACAWLPVLSGAGQEPVAAVTQVLPFAKTGNVTVTEKLVVNLEKAPSAASDGKTAPRKVSVAQEGSTLQVSQGGAASLVLGFDGTARIEGNSELKVPEDPHTGGSLELLKGSLFLNISGEALAKRKAGEFKLKTPTALLAVKGTQFFSISKDGADMIGVHEGAVVVTDASGKGGGIRLERGNAITFSAGSFGPVHAMTPEEASLGAKYAEAQLSPVVVPVMVHQKKPSPRTATYRDGRVVSVSQPAASFRNLDAHLWWQPYSSTAAGALDISPEGHVRFVWNQANENSRDEGAGPAAETALSLCFRGRRLERFGNDSAASPLLKVAALRFRFRASRVVSFKLASADAHSYVKPEGEDRYQAVAEHKPGTNQSGTTANAFVTHIIPVKPSGEWQEAMLPVVHRNYIQPAASAGSVDFASDDMLVRCAVRIEDPAGKGPNKAASTLEMKDFELLVVP